MEVSVKIVIFHCDYLRNRILQIDSNYMIAIITHWINGTFS